MRDETAEWLEPMFLEAQKRDIDILPLLGQASMPAAEADTPFLNWLTKQDFPPDMQMRGIDWVRFGQVLCHELGWCETYPAFPDFPEARDVP